MPPGPPTYHVVPRFDIATSHGALQLGTIVDDLVKLRPLNRNAIPSVARLAYRPVRHKGFSMTLTQLQEGQGGVWAKVLASKGAEKLGIKPAAETKTETTITCDMITTSYFDPDETYVGASFTVPSVEDYFIGSGYQKDVYMITGIKEAWGLRYESADTKLGGSDEELRKEQLDVNDLSIVVGFRVRRYAYVRASRNPVSSKKRSEGEDYFESAEMHGESGQEVQEPQAAYMEVPMESEDVVESQALQEGDVAEYWANPTA